MRNILETILLFPSISKLKVTLLLGITLTAAFFEGFGVAMLFPVMDFIEKGEDFSKLAGTSKMWSGIVNVFDFLFIPKTLVSLMAVVFCLLLVRQLFNYLKSLYTTWITQGILSDIRSLGFEWFAMADMPFYDSHGVGQLINVLTVDGVRAGGGISAFFNLLATAIIFVLYFVLLSILSPGMTLLAVVIMVGIGMVLRSRIRKSSRIGLEVSECNEEISSSVVERLDGIRLLKLAATEENETAFIRGLSEKIRLRTYNLVKIRAKMEFLVDPIVILAGLITLYFSVEVFHMSLAKTGIFIFVLLRLMPYTRNILKARQVLASFSGSLFRVGDLLLEAQKGKIIKGGKMPFSGMKKGIRFENVSFRYNPEEALALDTLDIHVAAGKMTALVGRSGAGKSTLVELIPRLRIPDEGRIAIDDLPIENFELPSLRRAIAFVSQEGFLFNDTVEMNIKYCRPDAPLDDVRKAAEMAYADHFIMEMPRGYKTMVGEKGVKLSGGQRQRIILARALLQEASIIILDEPTSALDSESEDFIQKAIEKIRSERNITMIIIAHRLSTIKRADQIIVLDKGRVVECGDHRELMCSENWYAEMVKMQAVG